MSLKNFARRFHECFVLPINHAPCIPDTVEMRIRLLQEELDELKEAVETHNLVEVLDALCDIRVVLDGTVLDCGMSHLYEKALEEVDRSNMSKMGADGFPVMREDGKLLKGEDYSPPDLRGILKLRQPHAVWGGSHYYADAEAFYADLGMEGAWAFGYGTENAAHAVSPQPLRRGQSLQYIATGQTVYNDGSGWGAHS